MLYLSVAAFIEFRKPLGDLRMSANDFRSRLEIRNGWKLASKWLANVDGSVGME